MVHDLQAYVPASISKTKRDYLWLLRNEHGAVFNHILNLKETGFATYADLRKPLVPFYTEHVLKKAKVPVRHSDKNNYCMRTSRAYRATEWIKLVTEYRLMKWEPEPLNPCQHEQEKMTMGHYATKGVDSKWQVQSRCCNKYAADPEKRQKWMEPWLRMQDAKP